MKRQRAERPPALHSPEKICCPYCDHEFPISAPSLGSEALTEPICALPYARDVDIFDPDPNVSGYTNGPWTTIGKDFFGVLNYESIGILHMEKGWQVLYSVARCPQCSRLIDVFANFTAGRRLADMWPHLLGKAANGSIAFWRPRGSFSSWSEDAFFLFLFFLVISVGSLVPELLPYFRNPVFDSERFRIETAPLCWLRGTMVVSLFLLFSLRKKLIGLFRNENALYRLFEIHSGLAYWSNFAVNRFTGYQRANRPFTLNAVTLLGAASSVFIFTAVWLTVIRHA